MSVHQRYERAWATRFIDVGSSANPQCIADITAGSLITIEAHE